MTADHSVHESSQAPVASGPVRLTCFEISQEPEKKTDYRQVIEHDDLPQEHRLFLEGRLMDLLRAFAGTPPQGEAVVCFPVHHLGRSHPRFCLCRCRIISRAEMRPYLRLQAVVGSYSHLHAAGIDPLALCYSDVWRHIEWDRCPVHTVNPDSYHVPDPYQAPHPGSSDPFVMADRATEALVSGEGAPLWLAPMPHEQAISSLRQVLSGLEPADLERASFALGIPAGCVLPTDPAVIIAESAAALSPSAIRTDGEMVESSNLEEKTDRFFQQLAGELATDPDVPAAWRHRLWNRCQDVITLIEESKQSVPGGAHGLAECFDRAAAALSLEIRRAGSHHDQGPIREHAARYSETLQRLDDRSSLPAPESARPVHRSTPDSTTLTITVIAIVVIFLLLWLR